MTRLEPGPLPFVLLLALSCAGSPGNVETVAPSGSPAATAVARDAAVEGANDVGTGIPESTEGDATPADDVPDATEVVQPVPSEPVASGPPPSPIRVALYRAPGVSMESHNATMEVLRGASGYAPRIVTPEEVRSGALDGHHVVIFTGGRGSVQGEALGDDGRRIVRDFVAAGGGYVGVCAGAYLALQGAEEFFKLALVAARNLSGDSWRRGEHTVEIREVGGDAVYRLFYANGPVFARVRHETLQPYVELATFLSDAYLPAHGTHSGEMPGTPAILASSYGRGRIVLFSPNPVLAAEGEATRPELMLRAVRWVATPGPVLPSLRFVDVFR